MGSIVKQNHIILIIQESENTMTVQIQKFGAVAFVLILILSLRMWDQPFTPETTSDSKEITSELAFLNDPPTNQVKPADRPIRTLRDISDAMVDVAEAANPTVVTVFTSRTVRQRRFDPFADFFGFRQPGTPQEDTRQLSGQGSGVIVSSDGYIITNAHVIQNADTVNVRLMNNRVFPAKVIGADTSTDIAVLQIEGTNFSAISLGDSDALRVGEWIMAIGSPLAENLAHTVTRGIVSAKGRSGVGLLDLEDFIQTDAAINPGNSGGALINLDGELVGINTAIASRSGGFQGIGFAIPINLARNIMRSLIETGTVNRGFIGVRMQAIDESIARAFNLDSPEGVLITEVTEGSPAEKAGLKEGDVILEADNRRVNNMNQMMAYVASKVPGDDIRLRVKRDNENLSFTVTVGKQTEEDRLAQSGSRGLWDRTGFAVTEITPEKLRELNVQANVRGVIVTEINQESRAYRNNLRQNDIIIGVNRRPVRTIEEFNQLAGSVEKGQVILLQVLRGRNTAFVAFEMN
ncbi:MAG: DegQ family serine endoprotease [Balneolales bacterium]|nr:DegQ family serine endoprotease [Balneolales bacterium]